MSRADAPRLSPARLALALASLAVGAVTLYYAVIYRGQLPYHWRLDGWNDIVLHIGAFGLLTLCLLPLFERRARPLIGLTLLAALAEGAQVFIPTRTASLIDLAASLAGVGLAALGLAALGAILRRWRTDPSSRGHA